MDNLDLWPRYPRRLFGAEPEQAFFLGPYVSSAASWMNAFHGTFTVAGPFAAVNEVVPLRSISLPFSILSLRTPYFLQSYQPSFSAPKLWHSAPKADDQRRDSATTNEEQASVALVTESETVTAGSVMTEMAKGRSGRGAVSVFGTLSACCWGPARTTMSRRARTRTSRSIGTGEKIASNG